MTTNTNNPTSPPGGGRAGGITPCLQQKAHAIAEQMAYFIPKSKKAKHSSRSYEHIAVQYLRTTYAQIIKGIKLATEEDLAKNQIPIYMDLLRDQNPGQYTYANKRCWWFDWLMKMYPQFRIVKQGYKYGNQKGTLTMAEINDFDIPEYQRQIGESPEETFRRYYQDYADQLIEDKNVDWAPIDTDSLTNYIEHTKHQQWADKKQQYRYELLAREILTVAEYCYQSGLTTEPALPQIQNPSKFGRMYYQGLNLQNLPSVIREAALGSHSKYDIVSSVFAWQLAVVNNEFLTPATKELVLQRAAFRRMLARDCVKVNVSEDLKIDIIKQALTAIGFGANLKGGAYFDITINDYRRNAIDSIIMNEDDRHRFQTHKWVQEFFKEQQQIRQYIADHVDLTLLPQDIEFTNKKNQIKISKVMAYLYQSYEYQVLSIIKENVPAVNQWLLMVHDGFYLKHRLGDTAVKELAQQINPYIQIERSSNRAWIVYEDSVKNQDIKQQLQQFFKARSQTEGYYAG